MSHQTRLLKLDMQDKHTRLERTKRETEALLVILPWCCAISISVIMWLSHALVYIISTTTIRSRLLPLNFYTLHGLRSRQFFFPVIQQKVMFPQRPATHLTSNPNGSTGFVTNTTAAQRMPLFGAAPPQGNSSFDSFSFPKCPAVDLVWWSSRWMLTQRSFELETGEFV